MHENTEAALDQRKQNNFNRGFWQGSVYGLHYSIHHVCLYLYLR